MAYIEKKRIKGRTYYYLTEARRVGGKIKKKRKYLGTKAPRGTKRRKTKKVGEVRYSQRLDPMALFIRDYLETAKGAKTDKLALKGIEDICYGYSKEFKTEFLKKVGLDNLPAFPASRPEKEYAGRFVSRISRFDGECAFLLRDTYKLLKEYRKKTGKGFGVLVNREYLCDGEEDYFALIHLLYQSLLESENQVEFFKNYLKNFKKFISKNKRFGRKSREIFEQVQRERSRDRIVWIDMGFQFTLSLFAYASVEVHSRGKIRQDIYLFSVYPWLRGFFKGRYFTPRNDLVLGLEFSAVEEYQKDAADRGAGALVGFAVGDSLGFPAAGIEKGEIHRFLKPEITGFVQNREHPFFSGLKAGQYTDNTRLMIISAQNIIANNGFEVDSYQEGLKEWGKAVLEGREAGRWAGPTALKAVSNLIKGKDFRESGIRDTESCSSSYRVVPLGIFYRDQLLDLKHFSELSGGITHNSAVSRAGAVLVSLIISSLMNGVAPGRAVESAIRAVKEDKGNRVLVRKVRDAVRSSKKKEAAYARKHLGTGSSIYQTLPLAVYCFLKHPEDFEKGILLAANSYREDTPGERKRLRGLSWKEQLQECKGGNTDGIAGLAGAFLGAYNGASKIPKKFFGVEDGKKLVQIGKTLAIWNRRRTLFIFDVDNTLLNSHSIYDEAYKRASRELLGREFIMTHNPDGSWDREFSNLSNMQILGKRLRQLGINERVIRADRFFERLDEFGQEAAKKKKPIVFKGVPGFLEKLSERNRLVIITNGMRGMQLAILKKAGLVEHFDLSNSLFMGGFRSKREAIGKLHRVFSKHHAFVYVGDSPGDMKAVKEAKTECKRVGVGTTVSGLVGRGELEDAGASLVLGNYTEDGVEKILKLVYR